MGKKESSFMAFVGLVCPLKGEKKLLLKQKKLRFSVKVNMYLRSYIYLKSGNVNIENEGAAGKTFCWDSPANCLKRNRKSYPCWKVSVTESVFVKIPRSDSSLATLLERSLHQRGFLIGKSEFSERSNTNSVFSKITSCGCNY